jgi:hypothetical protein
MYKLACEQGFKLTLSLHAMFLFIRALLTRSIYVFCHLWELADQCISNLFKGHRKHAIPKFVCRKLTIRCTSNARLCRSFAIPVARSLNVSRLQKLCCTLFVASKTAKSARISSVCTECVNASLRHRIRHTATPPLNPPKCLLRSH